MAFHRQWRKLNVQDAYSNVVPLVALDAASTERHLTTFGFSSDVKELKTLPPSETDLPWGAAFAGIDKVFPQRWLHADEKQAAELDALIAPSLSSAKAGSCTSAPPAITTPCCWTLWAPGLRATSRCSGD
ncbi:hypothetical protein HaLaN_05728 [Haematococcus lacustris]|uniref:Uncharacterized protein n=1 Tax=Haematococcus lacustris TaxID=44745 RepID=A0A699YVB5_HAELA|nr:hypothetical protein HaLaN_05728 [Haematococcus lacustris]